MATHHLHISARQSGEQRKNDEALRNPKCTKLEAKKKRSSREAGWATTDSAVHTIKQWSPSVITQTLTGTLLRRTSKNDRGDMQVDRKSLISTQQLYHLVEDLKLDRGDGEPWDPPIPTMPEHRTYSPALPSQKKLRCSGNYFIAVQNSFLVHPLVVITALLLHSPLQRILSKIVVL
ncbi:hypothetical protein C8F04DRAFT_1184797 [Mycena alexandri]|uniref:Uncharacterized protein n=1 Tax=Mycena alexandri TaxID=1745969 RepID=A0AAD6X1U1_9AGAR|nr:hypothetical protein C8F04DRAFT_1184797 [Mycena alexandri]